MLNIVRSKRGISLSERFHRYASPEPNSGCWLWLAGALRKGYGMLYVSPGKIKLATHISLELYGNQRPSPEHWALHKCDNPFCVNPDHLYWGTAVDNFSDMIARGRGRMDSTRKEICVRNHVLAETGYVRGDGYRQCRLCDRERAAERRRQLCSL